MLPEYRLDELATLSGVSVRNIRAYRERGLLDAPRREGRWAFYNDRHLAQLRAINELLRKGYTSAHIAEFLDGTRQGHDLADVLGLQQAIFGPPQQAAAGLEIDLDSDEARSLLRYGLAEVVDAALTLVNPHLAEIVGRATEPMAYVRTMLRVCDAISGVLDELATTAVDALEQSLLTELGQDYLPGPVADVRAVAQLVVADQLEDAVRRRLVGEASGERPDVARGGRGDLGSG